VEEQFYLIWPMIVLFSLPKHHFRFILLLAIGAFLFRLIFATSDLLFHGGYFDELTPACLDSFAAGAIL